LCWQFPQKRTAVSFSSEECRTARLRGGPVSTLAADEYFLTKACEGLFRILPGLREGERRLHPDEDPVNPGWRRCGAELHVETVCQACRDVITPEDLRYSDGS
jgi:hypothetical protein